MLCGLNRLLACKDACSEPSLPFCVQSRPGLKESPAGLGCRSLLVTHWGQARGRLRLRMMGQGHMQTGAQTVTRQMRRTSCHVASRSCHSTQNNAITLQACSWLLSEACLLHYLRSGACVPASVCCGPQLLMPACQLGHHTWRQSTCSCLVQRNICHVCLSSLAACLSNPDGLACSPRTAKTKGRPTALQIPGEGADQARAAAARQGQEQRAADYRSILAGGALGTVAATANRRRAVSAGRSNIEKLVRGRFRVGPS